MKKLSFALVLVALFVAGQAFAAQPVSVKSQTAQGSGGKGSMTNTIMETSVKDSNIVTSGQGSETNISTIENNGGSMTNTIMETKIDNSNVISTGGGKTNIGKISNQ